MALTYTQYLTNLANLLPIASTDADYTTILPTCIDDAEQRLYRELDLLNTVTTGTTALSTGTRSLSLPAALGSFIVTQQLNVITPSTTTSPDSGTRNPLAPASKEMIDYLYPSSTGSGVPSYFAMQGQSTVLVAPWPDKAYTVEWVGTLRPTALSSTVTTTLLSVYFPDLFIAASMVFMAGWMKNYGAAVDDPQQGISWEAHFKNLLQSAQVEEARKKFSAVGWSPRQPMPLATPPQS
jgi:hypothetical protein